MSLPYTTSSQLALSTSVYAAVWDRAWAAGFDPTQKYLVIRFIMSPDIISQIIGWQTDSLWCHCEMLSRDGNGWIGAHAGTGVNVRALNWCKVTRERRYAIPVTDAEYEAAMSWAEAKIGCPYDYEDIIGLLIHVRIGVSKHEVICSAFLTCSLQETVEHWPLNVLIETDNLITPETLHLSKEFMNRCIYDFPAAA